MFRHKLLIIGRLLLSLAPILWCHQAQASGPPLQPGDEVVALHDTYLWAGTEKLAPLEGGVSLIGGAVQDDWVAVTIELEGKIVTGWVYSGHLIVNPTIALATLAVRVTWDVDWLTTKDFNRMDRDGDGWVTLDEFLADTKSETLDDLNAQLRRELATHDDAMRPSQPLHMMSPNVVYFDPQSRSRWIASQIVQPTGSTSQVNVSFKNWKRKPLRHEAEEMVEDFLKTGDIRRSSVAQLLYDQEEPKLRAQRGRALFKWADKNSDGRLALEEFRQALPPPDKADKMAEDQLE